MTDIVERLKTFGAWAEVSHRHELTRDAAAEIERLRKMVKDAYNCGFNEGIREATSIRGGIPWNRCKFRKEIV